MTTEQTRTAPPTIAGIHARYEEIAPGPTSATPDPALAQARWLTFAAQRGFTRMLSPHLPMDHGEMLLMLARFEALHFLAAVRAADPAEARRLAREALDAAEDGGGVGEWLYEHGKALGVDTSEVGRLADREAELEAAGKGANAASAQAPDAFDLSRAVTRLDADLALARHAYKTVCGERDDLREEVGDVCAERARLVAFLAACYPAVRVPDWDDDEYGIVYVATPAGQVSWRVGSDWLDELFPHVPEEERAEHDGHTAEVTYERLRALTASVAAVRATGRGLAAGDDAAAVAAEDEREARQHARDMAAEDGDLDNCEATL